MLRRIARFAPALGLFACAAPEPPPPENRTVFEGARVIVGDGVRVIENAVFVVEDDRFLLVRRRRRDRGAARREPGGSRRAPR